MPPGVLLDSLSEREATLTEWQSQLQRREEIIRAAEISKEAYAASSSRTAAAQQHCHRTHTLLRPHRYEHVQSAAAELASRDAVLSQREAAVTVAEGRLLESESTRKAAHEAREAGITIRLGDVVQREKVGGTAQQQQHSNSARQAQQPLTVCHLPSLPIPSGGRRARGGAKAVRGGAGAKVGGQPAEDEGA